MTSKQISILTIIALIIIGLTAWTFTGVQVGGLNVAPVVSSLNLGLDIEGGVMVAYEVETDATGDELRMIMEQTRLILSQRINALGLTEPNIYIEGDKRIRVELPGVQDAQEALRVVGTTALLEFAQVKDGKGVMTGGVYDPELMTILFSGERVRDARAVANEYNQPSVSLSLDTEGARIFREATSQSINFVNGLLGTRNGQIAIMLDGEIISAPSVGVVISDGNALITGSFTTEEAQNLALLIRGGALPAKLEEIQASAIGPTLGRDALQTSIYAGMLGFILVVLFMVIYYRLPGIVASISLVLYGVLILLLMVGLNATLTLPGVAGIVLSLGMAVDANVIIFERIREELREGKTLRAALAHGYSKAIKTIVDSNITTLIAAVVLFNFGEGAIKGFAVTLMLGIVVSMFTAILVTRTVLNQFSHSKVLTNKKLYGATENKLASKFRVNFLAHYKAFFIASGAVIATGLVMFILFSFNLGIDFSGGTMLQVQFKESVTIEAVQESIREFGLSEDIIYAGNHQDEVIIKTTRALDNEERIKVFNAIQEKFGLSEDALRNAEQFGPNIGNEIKSRALFSVLLAAVGMLLYITFRFEFRFGLAAIIALVHDVLILLAVYAIFRIPVNSAFIAAVLTVVGYSINDTIVVFDRIRDNVKYAKTSNYMRIAQESLQQTVSRTINTSLTTLLVIGALLVLGSLSIKELAFPLLAGVVTGTYSSIFIASPVWVLLKKSAKAVNKA
jgi:SecD/SecF fusion protein